MITSTIDVESFCRLATGSGYKVSHDGRRYAVFLHRFGKQDITALDNRPLPPDTSEILDAVQNYVRGFDWQGGRE